MVIYYHTYYVRSVIYYRTHILHPTYPPTATASPPTTGTSQRTRKRYQIIYQHTHKTIMVCTPTLVLTLSFVASAYISCVALTATPLQHASTKYAANSSGEWAAAKLSLRDPNCCVVSITGLDHHLLVLQDYFCGPDAPSDLDLRAKIRCGNDNTLTTYDCFKIYNSITKPSQTKYKVNDFGDDFTLKTATKHPCILALEALASGVASLADGPLEGICKDVHMRIVFASNYEAKDPMFHTDKCPLRAYVTLTGPGTEYMDRTSHPWEYVTLRTLGAEAASNVSGLKMASILELIVTKGDKYDAPLPIDTKPSIIQALVGSIWERDAACVHRSPPAGDSSARRVIL